MRVVHLRAPHPMATSFSLYTCHTESIGNPWWLSNNPEIASWATGYQGLGLLVFLCVFPVELALRSVAMGITGMLVSGVDGKGAAGNGDAQGRQQGVQQHDGVLVQREFACNVGVHRLSSHHQKRPLHHTQIHHHHHNVAFCISCFILYTPLVAPLLLHGHPLPHPFAQSFKLTFG